MSGRKCGPCRSRHRVLYDRLRSQAPAGRPPSREDWTSTAAQTEESSPNVSRAGGTGLDEGDTGPPATRGPRTAPTVTGSLGGGRTSQRLLLGPPRRRPRRGRGPAGSERVDGPETGRRPPGKVRVGETTTYGRRRPTEPVADVATGRTAT